MPPDAHKNFAVSTVATAPSPASSGTSLVVAGGEGARFPATPFNATIHPTGANPDPSNAEVVRVTNISTDTFTITRAQESSSARTVIVGDRIYAGPTAKSLADIEASGTYRDILSWTGPFPSVTAAGTYIYSGAATFILLAAAGSAHGAFRLDPADLPTVPGASKYVRLRFLVTCNAVAPAVTFTAHLYPVATYGGAASASPSIATVGASLGNVAIASPAASVATPADSADIAFPAAGQFCLAVINSGTTASTSLEIARLTLQLKQS